MFGKCYNLCTLRTGVKIVAFYELICSILFFFSVFVCEMFSKLHPFYNDVDVYYFLQSCIIIITLLKLLASVSLMQATFQNTPYKIFLWIMVASIIYFVAFIVSIKLYVQKVYLSKHVVDFTEYDQIECNIQLVALIIINFISVIEIYLVTLYYQDEKYLEETTRIPKVISLRNHRLDVFNFMHSPVIYNHEDRSLFFTTFKGIPV